MLVLPAWWPTWARADPARPLPDRTCQQHPGRGLRERRRPLPQPHHLAQLHHRYGARPWDSHVTSIFGNVSSNPCRGADACIWVTRATRLPGGHDPRPGPGSGLRTGPGDLGIAGVQGCLHHRVSAALRTHPVCRRETAEGEGGEDLPTRLFKQGPEKHPRSWPLLPRFLLGTDLHLIRLPPRLDQCNSPPSRLLHICHIFLRCNQTSPAGRKLERKIELTFLPTAHRAPALTLCPAAPSRWPALFPASEPVCRPRPPTASEWGPPWPRRGLPFPARMPSCPTPSPRLLTGLSRPPEGPHPGLLTPTGGPGHHEWPTPPPPWEPPCLKPSLPKSQCANGCLLLSSLSAGRKPSQPGTGKNVARAVAPALVPLWVYFLDCEMGIRIDPAQRPETIQGDLCEAPGRCGHTAEAQGCGVLCFIHCHVLTPSYCHGTCCPCLV